MRTETTLATLVLHLQSNCGDMLDACGKAGVSMFFVAQWRKDDKKVDEVLKEAEALGVQCLVSAAIHRGVRGVDEDVYYKGVVVGQKKNYSDTLLNSLLKAKVPEFATGEGGGAHVTVNVANIMPRPDNYEDWLAMKSSTDKHLAEQKLLEQAEDAVFETVEPENIFKGIEL